MPVTLSPYAMTTLDAAKEHLGIPGANTTYDDIVTRYINASSGRIESYCDRKFIQRSFTEYQGGIANDRILLGQWPANKPTELWIDSTGLFTDADKQLDTGAYELDFSARGEGIGVVLTGGAGCHQLFPRGRRNIKIVYTAGYADLDALPDELEDACLWGMEFLYDMRNDRRIGTATKSKNQETITYYEDLPKIITQILDNYRRVEWPTGSRQVFTG